MPTVTFETHKTSAVIDVWDDKKTAELELVSSKYKKRGLATQALNDALEYADFYDLEVVLEVCPFTDSHHKMDEAELKAWYMTFGFKLEGDNLMSRPRKSERNPS